jgi:hypothetical protein
MPKVTISRSLHSLQMVPSVEYAEYWIKSGRVFLNGELLTDPAQEREVADGDTVKVLDGEFYHREVVRMQSLDNNRFDNGTDLGDVIQYLTEIQREADAEGMEVKVSRDYDHTDLIYHRKLKK